MDHNIFKEQIVKRTVTGRARLAKIGIVIAAVLLLALIMLIPAAMGFVPVLFVGTIVIAITLIRMQDVEFEYAQNGDTLDVDKIYGKSMRKNVTEVSFSSVIEVLKENREVRELKKTYNNVHDCTGFEGQIYSIVYTGVGEGYSILLFTPNERMLESLRRAISPRVWKCDE